jgi:hypothetical protein
MDAPQVRRLIVAGEAAAARKALAALPPASQLETASKHDYKAVRDACALGDVDLVADLLRALPDPAAALRAKNYEGVRRAASLGREALLYSLFGGEAPLLTRADALAARVEEMAKRHCKRDVANRFHAFFSTFHEVKQIVLIYMLTMEKTTAG